MDVNENIRNRIFKILEDNNFLEFKNFVENNHIVLKELNNKDFDLLTYAIEHFASSDIVDYIIQQGHYENLNYAFYSDGNMFPFFNDVNDIDNNDISINTSNYLNYKIPLFIAVLLERLNVADVLVKHHADINYKFKNSEGHTVNIIQFLFDFCKILDILNDTMVKYILSKGLNVKEISTDILNEIISNEYKNDILEIIFNNYIYDNNFILNLIGFSKNKISLSKAQLSKIISEEKSKIKLTELTYYSALKGGNYDGLNLLLDNDGGDEEKILDIINKYGILEKAVMNNNYNLVKKILSFKKLNLKYVDFENLMMKGVKNNNIEILMLLVDILNTNSYDFESSKIDFHKILLEISKRRNEVVMNFPVNVILNIVSNTSIKDINIQLFNGYTIKFMVLILNIAIKLHNFDLIKYIVSYLNYDIINNKDENDEYPILTSFYEITLHNDNYSTNIEIFKYLLENGADCNIKNKSGKPLFLLALFYQEYAAIKYLLKQYIFIDRENLYENHHPLIKAICDNKLDFVQFYINKNKKANVNVDVNNNGNINTNVNNNGNINTNVNNNGNINTNVNNNSDINTKDFYNNIDNNDNMTIDSPVNNGYGFKPLILSYLLNHHEIFQTLLKSSDAQKINEIDLHGYTLLHYALLREDLSTTKYLIEIGADVNYRENQFGRGNSAIDIAICMKNKELFYTVLSSNTISINSPNGRGDIPIMTFFRFTDYNSDKEIDIVNTLIQHGADVNFRDDFGISLLMYAIYNRSLVFVKLLIKNGANVNICVKDAFGRNKSLLMYAIETNEISIIKYMAEYSDIHFMGDDSITDLITIIENGNVEIFQYLDIFKSNTKINIIKDIIFHNKIDLLRTIVKHNLLNVNMKDENGDNLLANAIRLNNRKVVDYLIEQGADIYSVNNYGKSIIDISFEYCNDYFKYNENVNFISEAIYNKIKKLVFSNYGKK